MNRLSKISAILLFTATAHGLLANQDDLPTPPKQNAPWDLPAGVEDPHGTIKAAVDTMFRLAFADPRGCSYHHVAVTEAGEKFKARGWILPAEQNNPQRYAIGWNGLIYPVDQIDAEADLAADIKTLNAKGEFAEAPFANYQYESLEQVLAEFAGPPRMMRASAAPHLLLRLGQPFGFHPRPDDDPFASAPELDYYQLLEHARLLRGDGVAAYLDKDDQLAAARLPQFDRLWAEVLTYVPEMPADEPFGSPNPDLNSSWRDLLTDARRRLTPHPKFDQSEIARWISEWDEFDSWDDEAPPAEFMKVVAAGPAAIDPLLDCLQNDRRWTRIRYYLREDVSTVLRVRNLAIFALERVLQFQVVESAFDYTPFEEPWYEKTAATMQAFCDKYQNTTGGELWFRVLADESADLEHQMIAAESITHAPDTPSYMFSEQYFDRDRAWDLFCDPVASKEGEVLRARRAPSVLDLMKRAWLRERAYVDEQLAAGRNEVTWSGFVHGPDEVLRARAHKFLRLIEEWQPGNVDVLKAHYDWISKAVFTPTPIESIWSATFMLTGICEETLIRRLWSEDDTAMSDYEKLLRFSIKNGDAPIAVMEEFPKAPGMDKLAELVFTNDDAPRNLSKPWARFDSRTSLIEWDSPLLQLPSFRRALVGVLKSKEVQATLTTGPEIATLLYRHGESDSDHSETFGPNAALRCTARSESPVDIRLCDLIAYHLSPKHGPEVWITPAFHLDDPLPQRDAAIADWIKLLSQP